MKRAWWMVLLTLVCLVQRGSAQRDVTVYRVSVATVAACAAADASSSWGKQEANPMISWARPDRQFGWEMAVVKAGITGAALLFQRFALRRHWIKPRAAGISNFAFAVPLCGVAIRNSTVPTSGPTR